MKVSCAYEKCGERRVHHERPDEPRGVQMIEVPEGWSGQVFCSITCAVSAGAMTLGLDQEQRRVLHEKSKGSKYHSAEGCEFCQG